VSKLSNSKNNPWFFLKLLGSYKYFHWKMLK